MTLERNSPFGGKDWNDVRKEVAVRLASRYRRCNPDDIDDAVSAAIVDLVDYWINLPSSIDTTDPEKNYNYAVTRAKWVAQQFLHQRFDELHRERPGLGHNFDGVGDDQPIIEVADDGVGPEDATCDDAEFQCVREFLAQLPAKELRGWLSDFVAGTTETAQAAREGVSQPAISLRRKRGMQRLRDAAHSFGLIGDRGDLPTGVPQTQGGTGRDV